MPHQLGWVLLTGLLLSGYVATWMTALARARALDVTSGTGRRARASRGSCK